MQSRSLPVFFVTVNVVFFISYLWNWMSCIWVKTPSSNGKRNQDGSSLRRMWRREPRGGVNLTLPHSHSTPYWSSGNASNKVKSTAYYTGSRLKRVRLQRAPGWNKHFFSLGKELFWLTYNEQVFLNYVTRYKRDPVYSALHDEL